MSKSVEAYNILLKAWQGNKEAKDYPDFDDINEALDIIKQDLERLEKIENLRTTPNALETCLANYMNKCIELEKEYSNLQTDYDNKDFECIDLLKENQELKQMNKTLLIHNTEFSLGVPNILSENEKLKKAIEILKDKTHMVIVADTNNHFLIYDTYGSAVITKKEYKLLKEVL